VDDRACILRVVTLASLLLLATAPAAAAAHADGDPDEPGPLVLDLEERVRVELVLVDAIVVDRQERTIAGLGQGDFELLVDDRRREIATFDVDCPLGSRPDPSVGAERPALAAPPGAPRRYVFVIDYYHLGQLAVEVLGHVRDAIERLALPGERYMLMSLGQTLRVERSFTDDPAELLETLDRMIADRDLYFGHYERVTERRWYERLATLLDLMERVPGQKSVVLFSGPLLHDGWDYDPAFDAIAAMATRSRTAFYPVDTRGLTLDDIMGPPALRRLALESGGRATGGTNDLGRAFARAQRDQGCRYTIGFHDRRPQLDQPRKLTLFVRRDGHRVLHPTHYVVRSERAERRSLAATAARVPELFAHDGLSAELQLLAPASGSRWSALAELGIDPALAEDAPADARWTLRVQLRKPNGTLHRGLRRERLIVPPRPTDPPSLLVERFEPRPGRYALEVVVAGPGLEEPVATTLDVVVPALPRGH
jgi:VWFA-related protein